jgi:thiamine kinase
VSRAEPAQIAATALGIEVDAIVSVEPVKHGLTNESWIVRTTKETVVVRLSSSADRALQIDRGSEAVVLGVVARADIGPPVLQCDPAGHILVTRYLGETWGRDYACYTPNIRRLATTLRRLHGLAMPAGVRRVDLRSTVSGYLQTLHERGAASVLTSQPLRERAAQVADELQRGSTPCLCHNDVHHLNVIDDGELRLIDWEYAGIGERLFDLAAVSVYHQFDTPRREHLLTAYAENPAAVDPARFEQACWLFDYVRELWMAVREGGQADTC